MHKCTTILTISAESSRLPASACQSSSSREVEWPLFDMWLRDELQTIISEECCYNKYRLIKVGSV